MAADSILEPISLLYRATSDRRYLDFACHIVSNQHAPGGPAILASLEKYHSVKRVANGKAYEMESNFNGLLELYRITGEAELLADMKVAWTDIVKNRLYLTGSASSYEVFQDNDHFPDGQKSNICETCVTVTWEQMNLQLLRLTGDPRFADQVERSVYNHLMGAQKPTGDDWCYYTPLDGHKQYDKYITCCHSSGPRGIALLPEFAYMVSPKSDAIVVNLYNDSRLTTILPKAGRVTLEQTTNYPLEGGIHFTVTPEHNGVKFPLTLRIPAGVGGTFSVSVNGSTLPMDYLSNGDAGYCKIDRTWKRGDRVTLDLPIQTKLVMGKNADDGRAAIVRGALVLALDAELNPGAGFAEWRGPGIIRSEQAERTHGTGEIPSGRTRVQRSGNYWRRRKAHTNLSRAVCNSRRRWQEPVLGLDCLAGQSGCPWWYRLRVLRCSKPRIACRQP